MKKAFILVLFISIFSIIHSAGINVISPDGASYWNIGEKKLIQWNSRGDMNKYVKIRLFDKTGNIKLLGISDKTSNDGRFEWTIPRSIREGEYIIKVKTLDNLVFDNSAIFHIQSRQSIKINLISPSTGSRYQAPGSILFKWEMENSQLVENVRLILKKNGVIKSQIILDNDGSETGPLTDDINDGSDYSVRIEDADDPTIFDETGYFEIYHSTPSSIRLKSNLNYSYSVGEIMRLKWDCQGFDGLVKVDLFKNGSLSSVLISSTKDNYFNWKINSPPGTQYLIKVSALNKPDLFDSGNYFVILESADFLVFSRRGIFEKNIYTKGESTKLRFIVSNSTKERVPVTFSIRFFKGKIKRPSRIALKTMYIVAKTVYSGRSNANLNAASNTTFELPIIINDLPGDYTVRITVLPSRSSNIKDKNKGNNTIYGYYKVVLNRLKRF